MGDISVFKIFLKNRIALLYNSNLNLFNFRAAKEVKKTTKAAKKPAPAAAKTAVKKPAAKANKNVQKAAPRVGGKR